MIGAPDFIEYVLMGHHLAGVLGKRVKHLVFLGGQRELRAFERDSSIRQADFERAALDDGIAGGPACVPA